MDYTIAWLELHPRPKHRARWSEMRHVVDPICRVNGVDTLRFVDAAIMPTIPRAVELPRVWQVWHQCAASVGQIGGLPGAN